MSSDRLSRLTDGQRACLRLVYLHRSSKEIARELGISSHTVDQRLRVAMRILGAASRIEAARMLVDQEGVSYQPLIYQPAPIDRDPGDRQPDLISGEAEPETETRGVLREEQAAFDAAPPPPSSFTLRLPIQGRQRNDLGAWQRLGWIIAIAVAVALGFGGLLAGLHALVQIRPSL